MQIIEAAGRTDLKDGILQFFKESIVPTIIEFQKGINEDCSIAGLESNKRSDNGTHINDLMDHIMSCVSEKQVSN